MHDKRDRLGRSFDSAMKLTAVLSTGVLFFSLARAQSPVPADPLYGSVCGPIAPAVSSSVGAPATLPAVNPPVPNPNEIFEAPYSTLAMGTLVNVRMYSDKEDGLGRAVDLFDKKLSEYETLFTAHGQGPLNDINQKAGQWLAVDCRLARLIQDAKRLAKESGQAFEPTIGPLVNVWKIGFGGQAHPKKQDIDAALKRIDYRRIDVEMKPQACRVRIGKDQNIDLGAIAKGWIGTALINDIKSAGVEHAIVDLGGNVALLGNSIAGRPWRVGVQRPDADRGVTMALIEGADESIITSGAYERKIEVNGKRYGHILNVKTGEPALTDIGSVTIVDADGARADGWCTALFGMGVKKALEVMKTHKDLHVFIVDQDLTHAWVSKSLADRVKILDKSVTMTVVE